MIRPGTLCLLVGDHMHAGKCCTTTGPLHTVLHMTSQGITTSPTYPIDIQGLPPPPSTRGYRVLGWGALPSELIPLAPPGLHDDEPARTDKPQRVSA